MSGLDCLGCDDDVGFDYMSLLKGGAGMLQGAGGLMSGGMLPGAGAPASGKPPVAPSSPEIVRLPGIPASTDTERLRLQMEKERVERSASTLKIVVIALASLIGVGGLIAVLRK